MLFQLFDPFLLDFAIYSKVTRDELLRLRSIDLALDVIDKFPSIF